MKALGILALALFFIPLQQGRPAQSEGVDPRLKMIKEEIAKTTPEGKEIIERVKKMLPEVNRKLSTLPLEKLVENYVKEKNLVPVGWAASKLWSGSPPIHYAAKVYGRFGFSTRWTPRNIVPPNGDMTLKQARCIRSIRSMKVTRRSFGPDQLRGED
jgi:hypothetical protein